MRLLISLCIVTGVAFAGAQKPLNKTECVEWHNYYRKIHQAPNVSWSNSAATDAKAWADDLARRDVFKHATGEKRNHQGENLFRSTGDSENLCQKATKEFYSEEKFYNYDADKYVEKAGHFSQVVWVGSTEIGVGKAQAKSGAVYLVFRYKPAGNIIGHFAENVKPPIGEASANHPSLVYSLAFSIISVMMAQQVL